MNILLFFVFGVCIGSFLNVIVLRTYTKESIVRGRSKCTYCHTKIRAFDLVPILSFLFLRGVCRACKQKIDWQYLIVEFVTACLFVLVFLRSNFFHVSSLETARDLIFVCTLVLIFVYDYRYMIIPDRFTFPAIIFASIVNISLHTVSISSMLIGAIIIGGFFLAQFLFSNGRWIGGGDIRMGILMGCMFGLANGLVALFLSYVFGSLIGISLLLLKKVDRKTQIPFGTFLTAGSVVVLLTGTQILDWYLGFMRV